MRSIDLSLAFEALFESLPHAILLVDPQRRIKAVNPAFTRMFGYDANEVIGRDPRLLYASVSDYEGVGGSAFRQALEHREALFETHYRRKDGSLFWAESAGVGVFDGAGQPVGVIGLHVDVSARHAAEERLRQSHAELAEIVQQRTAQLAAANEELGRRASLADEANRAKSFFLASMSHEIRTPMNAIIGLTHLLSQELTDPLHCERLAKIDGAAKHLLGVINDILDLSKIEAGKMTLRVADFSLEDTMAGALQMVNAAAQEKGLELILDADHLPQHARGDATRLSQALINLLANAVKFTDAGWVRLRGTLASDDGHQLELLFEVQDTGPGIDAQRLSRLFEPFEQADTSHARRHGGTGLGLALTRHLAQMMGGSAGASSTPGQGSVFWMRVVLQHPMRASQLAAPISLAGRRALIVDDLPEALAAEADRLLMFGMDVTQALSGARALELTADEYAAGRSYDVVLLDWKMPGMDGIATLAALRGLLGAGMPPAILFTAYSDPRLRALAAEVGCLEVLDKPTTSSAIQDTLVRLLRPHAAVSRAPLAEDAGSLRQRVLRQHAGQRVLLVEDNPVNSEVATELLRRAQLVVETAEDGARAVELVAQRAYDLVLMDVQMPGVDGLEATRRIRRIIGPALAIVAMTANAFDDDREACIEAGMNDHVAKPVDPDRLYQVLLNWLPMQSARSRQTQPVGEELPLERRLHDLPAINYERALWRVGNSVKTMERVLACFADHYRQGDSALRRAIETSDLRMIEPAAHALAGACGSVGADDLERQARSLIEALRDGREPEAIWDRARELNDGLSQLATRLAAALDLTTRPAP